MILNLQEAKDAKTKAKKKQGEFDIIEANSPAVKPHLVDEYHER